MIIVYRIPASKRPVGVLLSRTGVEWTQIAPFFIVQPILAMQNELALELELMFLKLLLEEMSFMRCGVTILVSGRRKSSIPLWSMWTTALTVKGQ